MDGFKKRKKCGWVPESKRGWGRVYYCKELNEGGYVYVCREMMVWG